MVNNVLTVGRVSLGFRKGLSGSKKAHGCAVLLLTRGLDTSEEWVQLPVKRSVIPLVR